MKTFHADPDAALRPPASANYTDHNEGFIVRYNYRRPWSKQTPEEKCDTLGFIAADLRRLAEQMETARLEIAQGELAA